MIYMPVLHHQNVFLFLFIISFVCTNLDNIEKFNITNKKVTRKLKCTFSYLLLQLRKMQAW